MLQREKEREREEEKGGTYGFFSLSHSGNFSSKCSPPGQTRKNVSLNDVNEKAPTLRETENGEGKNPFSALGPLGTFFIATSIPF